MNNTVTTGPRWHRRTWTIGALLLTALMLLIAASGIFFGSQSSTLLLVGDPAVYATLRDGGPRPVDAWWPHIRAHWPHVRHTSYARALRITARDLYGIERIDDTTIHAMAARPTSNGFPS